MRSSLVAALALGFAGAAYGHHCTGYSSWATSGGGHYVAAYNDPKWLACVGAAAGRHDSFESWVGAQYACEGTYPKPTGGSAFLRIYRCVKSSATGGYCTWADAPLGAPWGHADNVNTAHACGTCSAGFHWTGESACVLGNGDGCNFGAPACEKCGNPIHGATGNKYQREVDYTGRGPFAISFERSYNSFIGFSRGSIGPYWRSNYDRVLKVRPYGSFGAAPHQWVVSNVHITATRADGKELSFTATVDSSTGYQLAEGTFLTAPAYARERLEKTATGFRLYTAADEIETYSSSGKLQSISDRHGRTQLLQYDANGRLGAITDPVGKQIALAYNAQGRLSQMTDPGGGIYQYAYDASGRLTTVTYPGAAIRTYLYENTAIPHLLTGIVDENGDRFATWTYGSLGRAAVSEHAGGAERVALSYDTDGTTTEVDALGKTRRLRFSNISGLLRLVSTSVSCTGCSSSSDGVTYDAGGNVESRTDFNGNITRYTHDARGLEASRTEAYGTALSRSIETQWHETFRVPTRVDEPGRSTTYSYDGKGNRLTQAVRDTATNEVRTTIWTYDALGQVLSVDGPRTDVGDLTTYTYHDCTTGAQCGQIHTVTNALGQVTTVPGYDAHGNPLAIVDPNGVITTLTYDARQRLVTRTVAGATTRYDYDGVGQLVRVTLPDGAYLDYTYDAAHRLTGIGDNLGNRIHYALDALGNRIQEEVFDPAGTLKRAQSRVFDAQSRLEQVRNAAGEVVTRYGYDSNGNRTGQVDYSTPTMGHSTVFVRDALNRIVQVIDAAGGVARYGYDALDQLVSVTDPGNLATRYLPNAMGDLKEQESPDTGTSTYTYDAAGNRKTQTDARGVSVSYSYDALNRLTFVDYPEKPSSTSEDVTYTYDSAAQPYGKGRLTGIADRSGATTLIYDARGNVTEERRVIAGRTYVTGYGYDDAGRLAQITYPSGRTVNYVRNALGQVDNVMAGDGPLARNIGYLPFGPMSGYAMGNGILVNRIHDQDYRLSEYEDGAVQHLRLYYDLRGDLEATESLLDAARSQSFGYDALSRLTSAVGLYGVQHYSYDGVGNRLTQSSSTYNYVPGSHRLSEISDGSSFSYDDAGNSVARDSLMLTYGAAGRLQEALRGTRRLSQYVHNAAGQRAIKTAIEPGPDYLAMAEEADRKAMERRQEAQRLDTLADQYDQQALSLLTDAARLEEQATALLAQADLARAEAAAYLDEAQPYLAKAANWQQRADEDRQTAESATGMRREALLRQAEREEAKAAEYLAKAQPHLDQQQQALDHAAQLDQQAQTLLALAQAPRDEARRLTDLAQAMRLESQQQIAQAEELEQQAAEYRLLAQEQEQNPAWVTTHFVHDRNGSLLGEYKDDGSVVREYLWLDDMPLALFTGADPAAHFIHSDHLNTPQKVTDASGQVVWDASYEPFGKVSLLTDAIEQPLRFPGQYFDAETGLHQNWFRDYDPSIGRYLQSDPIGLDGGLNTYAYVGANPLKWSDPKGLWVPGIHLRMTESAVLRLNCRKLNSKLPTAVVKVDKLPGSQDPVNSHWHHMSQPGESKEQAAERYNRHVAENSGGCDIAKLAFAIHDVQDSLSPAHRDYQTWYGMHDTSWLDLLNHGRQDSGIDDGTFHQGVDATMQILEKAISQCPCLCE